MGWSGEKVFPKGRRRGHGDRLNRAGGKVGRLKRKPLTQQNPFTAGKIGNAKSPHSGLRPPSPVRRARENDCHGRHDCHKERRRIMMILSLSKVSFPESAGDNRDIRDNRGGRSSRSSPIVTGLSWRATGAKISGRTRQSGRLSRLARLSRGRGRKPHFGERFNSTSAVSAAPESCRCKRRRNT